MKHDLGHESSTDAFDNERRGEAQRGRRFFLARHFCDLAHNLPPFSFNRAARAFRPSCSITLHGPCITICPIRVWKILPIHVSQRAQRVPSQGNARHPLTGLATQVILVLLKSTLFGPQDELASTLLCQAAKGGCRTSVAQTRLRPRRLIFQCFISVVGTVWLMYKVLMKTLTLRGRNVAIALDRRQ